MKVTITIPVYNTAKYLDKCLSSVLGQTYKNIEVIAIDDGSTDDSPAMLDRWAERDERLRVVHQANAGSAVARQSAMDIATGEYIIGVDSDDWCESTMIEDLYAVAKRDNADIVICDYFINYPSKELYCSQPACSSAIDCADKLLRGELHGSLWNKLVRRSLYTDHNIHFTPGLNLWEDATICIKLFCVTRSISYLPQAYLHYVHRGNSMIYTPSQAYLMNTIDAVAEMQNAITTNGLQGQLEQGLMYRKVIVKSNLIASVRGERQKQYAKYYKEADDFVFSHPTLKLHNKIALYLANRGYLWASNMIFDIIKVAKKIIK